MNVDLVTEKTYKLAYVESETKEGHYYKITCEDNEWTCSCPNQREGDCKHIIAVQEAK